MRQAFHSVDLIGTPPIGVSLGYDHCSEHEWGIAKIKWAMGVDPVAEPGIARRLMRRPLTKLHILEFKATKTLPAEVRIALNLNSYTLPLFQDRRRTLCGKINDKLSAAWSDSSFMVRAFSDDARQLLRDIHAAFGRRDLAIGLGGAQPFGNAPLSLVIASRYPDALAEKLREADEDHDALEVAAKATGIAERLIAAGKSFYALKPSWITTFKDMGDDKGPPAERSAHPVMFWLNPRDQMNNNYGWYTVEDLEAWVRNEGPVPKATRAAAR